MKNCQVKYCKKTWENLKHANNLVRQIYKRKKLGKRKTCEWNVMIGQSRSNFIVSQHILFAALSHNADSSIRAIWD